MKVRESQEIRVKVQRSLKEAEAQSFELYHPQVDQAIRKKEELHKALREQREPTPEEALARRLHKELVTEEMLDNEMAILAPLQEGMQALPSDEVANEGARALRKVNLERFKAKLRDRALTPARHWLRRWAPFRRPRRQTSESRTPTRHGCSTTLSSPWKCRRGRMISGRPWRGAYSAPWSWRTPTTSIKEKYVPYIKMLRASQNPWHQEALLEEMPELEAPAPCKGATGPGADQPMCQQDLDSEDGKLSLILWAMKRHQGAPSSWPLSTGLTHAHAHRPSHLHGLGDPGSGEPG